MTGNPNSLNRTLASAGAIANIIVATTVVARFVRQDSLLVIAILLIAGGIGIALYRLIKRRIVDQANLFIVVGACVASFAMAVVFLALLSGVRVSGVQIQVTEPEANATINGYRHIVKGTTSDPDARIYVLVRPLETPQDIWVQDPPTIDSTGKWQINAYFGERNAGSGEDFEVSAIATNENFLVTFATGNLKFIGKTDSIPSNTNRSNFVTVSRMR